MNILSNSRRGQTLVEALVALSILTMGFIGIVSLLTKSFQLNRTVSNDTEATYLAAEGIEVTKNLIDHDVYAGFSLGPGDDLFGDCFGGLSGYFYPIDYETTKCTLNFSHGVPAGADQLYYNPTTHIYSFNPAGGVLSNFTRDIKITENFDPVSSILVEIDVQSIVTWTDGGLSNTITLEDHFYNWHP
jgi:hypothetical protein